MSRAWGVLLLSLAVALTGPARAAGVGDPAPELKVKDWINSAPLTLSAMRDKIVVVEFWATWCPPCVASIPHLIDVQNKYKSKGVVVVGLTNQKKEKITDFVKEHRMTYAIGTSTTSLNDYAVSGIPAAFIVRNGEIFWRGHPTGLDVAIEAALRYKPAAKTREAAEVAAPAEPAPIAPAVSDAPKNEQVDTEPRTPSKAAVEAAEAPRSSEMLHEVTYIMKDGRRIEADQALEAGDEWAVKDKSGKYQMLKKSDVAEVKL